MKLLSIYNPEEEKILRSNSRLVTQEDRDSGLVGDIISEMKIFAEKYPNSVGFSAVQLGHPIQLFYINCRPTDSFPNMSKFESFVINPLLKSKGDETFDGYEGCMSVADENGIPTNRRRVHRSTSVIFDYADAEGTLYQDCELSGFTAVIWQHEYDHLYGKLIDETGYDNISQKEYSDRFKSGEKGLFLDR